ncbi:hypothetical protein AV530_019297 [Patagioenas fasciata monilis]|uniref:Uncharacterized protein n=1 Tax=Patagioenas fasciata monilis TaxID=372326 RepID=A0A1V4JCL4_PATFA|nr:hypothetical protein AV530_019297 [Patagioenas fasciata monilis]
MLRGTHRAVAATGGGPAHLSCCLPRLETEPAGSYFACPLQSPDGPEQPLLGAGLQPPGTEKGKDGLMRELQMARDKAPAHPLLPGEPRGGTGLHKRGPHPNPSLLPLHPSLALPAKEKRKAALLYPPPPHAVEAQPSTLPGTYKAFGSAGSGEPFPGSYLKPQAPRSYFPSPLDTYVPRTAAAFGTSFASAEPGCERHRAESPQRQVTLLREWLQRAEPAEELGETPKSPPKPKNGSKVPEAQKRTKGKEIWLAFQDVPALLANLLSQLKTFMFACKCPFPHVVRAGAIFIPIHVVKEKLFPKLPGASVDQVLQEHKVELRPTTLSEERHLRDLELKSCTSRMLKLLALKQLPDIYPDLLNLHWHDSIRQQLGWSSQAGQRPSK